jgi:hypothetical protein
MSACVQLAARRGIEKHPDLARAIKLPLTRTDLAFANGKLIFHPQEVPFSFFGAGKEKAALSDGPPAV